MTGDMPTAPGWYPDEAAAGTRYWDGKRWTGDTRPPRRALAAASVNRGWGIALAAIGALVVLTSPAQFGRQTADSSMSPAAVFIVSLLLGIVLVLWGIYLLRGRGPSTKEVLARLDAERLAAAARRQPPPPTAQASSPTVQINLNNAASSESAAAAQVQAIANPETAKALQNLQNLLYTRTITDAEYQAAKNKLLGDLQS